MRNLIRRALNTYREKRFYARLFKDRNVQLVFDVGANIGKKTELFLKSNCRVVAIEPNRACYPALQQLKKAYKQLELEAAAVSTQAGKGQLHIGSHIEISTLSSKMMEVFTVKDEVFWEGTAEVDTLTLQHLFDRYGVPGFIKLDCEGSDYAIIQSLLVPVPLIEFEYTKPFLSETQEAVTYLSTLAGYRFQFSAYESARLLLDEWLDAPAFLKELDRLSAQIIHGNIYCTLPVQA